MKKLIFLVLIICLHIINTQILNAVEIQSAPKINLTVFLEAGYYDAEHLYNKFILDKAGISVTALHKELLTGVLELTYSDRSDTFLIDDQIRFNKIALLITQTNGGFIIGKYLNYSLLRQSDIYLRKLSSLILGDMLISQTNPIGIQYYTKFPKYSFNIGVFNSARLNFAPVYNRSNPSVKTICFNYDDYSNDNKDIYSSFGFNVNNNLFFKTGVLVGKLNNNDIQYLRAETAAPQNFNNTDKNMWYISAEQTYGSGIFQLNYYSYRISDLRLPVWETLFNYLIKDNFSIGFAYTNIKHKNVVSPSKLLLDKTQYLTAIGYKYSEVSFFYEYIINHENAAPVAQLDKKNNTHTFKIIYKF